MSVLKLLNRHLHLLLLHLQTEAVEQVLPSVEQD